MSWSARLVRNGQALIIRHNFRLARHYTTPSFNGAGVPLGNTQPSITKSDYGREYVSLHPKVDDFVKRLDTALVTGDLTAIHKTLPRLMQAADDAKRNRLWFISPLNYQHLQHIAKLLVSSGRPFDIMLLERIVRKPRGLFDSPPDMNLHALVAQTMYERNNYESLQRAYQYLLSLPDRFHGKSPSPSMWHQFLLRCAEVGNIDLLRKAEKILADKKIQLPADSQPIRIAEFQPVRYTPDSSSDGKDGIEGIENALKNQNIESALALYRKALSEGVTPAYALAFPLIQALCLQSSADQSSDGLDKALELYEDARKAARPTGRVEQENRTHDMTNIYGLLLEGLSSSTSVLSSGFIAKTLLNNMAAEGIELRSSRGIAATTIVSMRTAADFSEAFKLYQSLCQRKGGPRLDRLGYISVLRAFCALTPGGVDNGPSVDDYFHIVRDMRLAGHAISSDIYILILRRLASLNDPNNELGAVAMVRGVNQRLKLDASFNPGTDLLNIFMETYFRLGGWTEAFDVWKEMCISGQYDSETVQTICNACAGRGAWTVSAQICTQLYGSGFVLDKRSWDMWIEALVRSGDLNQAARLVCKKMGKRRGEPQPDEKTVDILLSLTSREDQRAEIRKKINQYQPDLYLTLSLHDQAENF